MKRFTVARRDSYHQFPRSPLGTPGTIIHFWHAHKKKKKKEKETQYIFSLAADGSVTKDTFSLLKTLRVTWNSTQ